MSELFFVLRCFLVTVFIALSMQIRVSGIPLEVRADQWIRSSAVTAYLQGAASGGAVALQDMYTSLKRLVSDTASSFDKSESQNKR